MGMEVMGLGGLIVLALDIWALVHIVNSRASTGAKVIWALAVVVFPILGFIVWLIAGPRSSGALA